MFKKASLVTVTVLSLATPFVAKEEGLRTKAYLDSVGIATICYGETENIKLGDIKTIPECNTMLMMKLGATAVFVDQIVGQPMTVHTHAALTSWVYNVGMSAARKSTLIKLARKGQMEAACHQLPRWKYAGGKPILLGRRLREMELCLTGT